VKKQKINDGRLQNIVERILAVSDPDKIVLYGSRAKQTGSSLSDFDIAVLGKVNMGRIWDSLQDARTLLNIDVVEFDDLPEGKFKNRILEEGVIIYERQA